MSPSWIRWGGLAAACRFASAVGLAGVSRFASTAAVVVAVAVVALATTTTTVTMAAIERTAQERDQIQVRVREQGQPLDPETRPCPMSDTRNTLPL